jgi:DNA-binding NarL/FixJ family response regulator
MTLLIVDDNAGMRQLIRSFVRDLDAAIFECAEGARALELARSERPDWVLMDIRLGRDDGIEITRRIRTELPEVRVLIVTDYDSVHLRRAAARAGACGYICKDDLVELRRFLTGGDQ